MPLFLPSSLLNIKTGDAIDNVFCVNKSEAVQDEYENVISLYIVTEGEDMNNCNRATNLTIKVEWCGEASA